MIILKTQWHWIPLQMIGIRRRHWMLVFKNIFNINLSGKYYLDAMQPIRAVLTANFRVWVPPWPQCALVFDWSIGVMADSDRHGSTNWKQNLIIWQYILVGWKCHDSMVLFSSDKDQNRVQGKTYSPSINCLTVITYEN